MILRTIEQLPSLRTWTVMVQREIADRLRAAPGSRTYGSPSVLVQLACEVRLAAQGRPGGLPPAAAGRLGDPRACAAPGPAPTRRRASWSGRPSPTAARRWRARSSTSSRASLAAARAALEELGLPADARAEALAPEEFAALSAKLRGSD